MLIFLLASLMFFASPYDIAITLFAILMPPPPLDYAAAAFRLLWLLILMPHYYAYS